MTKPPFIKPIITYARTPEESVSGRGVHLDRVKEQEEGTDRFKLDFNYKGVEERALRNLILEKGLKSTTDEEVLPTGEYQVIGVEEDDLPTREYTSHDILKVSEEWKEQIKEDEPTHDLKLEDIFPGLSELEVEEFKQMTKDQTLNPMNKVQFDILYSKVITRGEGGKLQVRGYEDKLHLVDVTSTTYSNNTFYQLGMTFLNCELTITLDLIGDLPHSTISLEGSEGLLGTHRTEDFGNEVDLKHFLDLAVDYEEEKTTPNQSPSMRDLKKQLGEQGKTPRQTTGELDRAVKIYEWIKEQERRGRTFYVSNNGSPQIDKVKFTKE